MSIRLTFLIAILVFGHLPASAQLHLIVGTTDPNRGTQFALVLYRVDPDGAILTVNELVPRSPGAARVIISYDSHRAVILAQGGEPPLVLDLDTATVVKRCPSP